MKNEGRVERTRSEIRQALLDLLQEEPWGKITVAEITRKADVSRKTFYDHYHDIFDLAADCYYMLCIYEYDIMEFDIPNDIVNITNAYAEQLIKQLNFYRNNRNFATMVFDNALVSPYFSRLVDCNVKLFKNYIDLTCPEDQRSNVISKNLLSRCVFSAHQLIAQDWIMHGCKEPVENIAIRMHYMGIRIADSINAGKSTSSPWIEAILSFTPSNSTEPAAATSAGS